MFTESHYYYFLTPYYVCHSSTRLVGRFTNNRIRDCSWGAPTTRLKSRVRYDSETPVLSGPHLRSTCVLIERSESTRGIGEVQSQRDYIYLSLISTCLSKDTSPVCTFFVNHVQDRPWFYSVIIDNEDNKGLKIWYVFVFTRY